ncbi:MAG: VCBS repeat-containing protein [Bacteroidetes bacterium]|nr:VCBS repeat-containing protein [Bacteroidota bacterium]
MCSKWVDLDNDGDLDIAMFGYITSYYSKALLIYYENKGDNQFAELFRKESMESVMPNSISLGNYDNDGDLDFLLQTKNWENYRRLFRNNYNNSNVKPNPPNKFGVKREGTKTILYWNSGSDTETPTKTRNIISGSALHQALQILFCHRQI